MYSSGPRSGRPLASSSPSSSIRPSTTRGRHLRRLLSVRPCPSWRWHGDRLGRGASSKTCTPSALALEGTGEMYGYRRAHSSTRADLELRAVLLERSSCHHEADTGAALATGDERHTKLLLYLARNPGAGVTHPPDLRPVGARPRRDQDRAARGRRLDRVEHDVHERLHELGAEANDTAAPGMNQE